MCCETIWNNFCCISKSCIIRTIGIFTVNETGNVIDFKTFKFQRKQLESKQAAEENARLLRASLQYEVTTAKVDDQIAEKARSEIQVQ